MIVAAAIVDSLESPSHVLCAQRSAPAALDGKWEFPGGKVEPDEDPRDALIRELAEELGVELRIGERVLNDGSDWPLPNGHDMRVWLVEISTGTAQPLQDHHELRWVCLEDLPDLDWLEGDIPIVAQLRTQLHS